MRTVEVHNVWTIYGLDENEQEVEEPFAQMSRPQDWGNADRWHYERFRFDWMQSDLNQHYIASRPLLDGFDVG